MTGSDFSTLTSFFRADDSVRVVTPLEHGVSTIVGSAFTCGRSGFTCNIGSLDVVSSAD